MQGTSDAGSYIAVVTAIVQGEMPEDPFFARVFPGWPLFIAPVYVIFSSEWAPVILTLLIASLLPSLHFLLTKDRVASLVMTCGLPCLLAGPAFLTNEHFYLMMIYLSCLAGKHSKYHLASLITGLTAWIRPLSFFLWIGQSLIYLRQRQIKTWLTTSIIAGGVVLMMFVFNKAVFGVPFIQFQQYSCLPNISPEQFQMLNLQEGQGSHSGFPFVNLVKASLYTNPPLWKQIFVWSHVLFLCGLILFCFIRPQFKDEEWSLHFINSLGVALFIFSTGPYWAFHSFDRYFSWGLPSYLILLRPLMPKRLIWPVIYIVLCVAVSLWRTLR